MGTQEKKLQSINTKNVFGISLIAGGVAGTVVDLSLFPLDTLKTRLQSKEGFLKSGGFDGLYKGILPTIIGSAPTAALFFVTYEGIKTIVQPKLPERYHSFVHMSAASAAEITACLIRVPVEVMKQRKQALLKDDKLGLRLLYRGYWSTVFRDMPFSLLQFPIWEYFKKEWKSYVQRDVKPVESAFCGAIAGSISAAATTPLDVIKTRIMLSSKTSLSSELKMLYIFQGILTENGLQGLFAGLGPRTLWITLGGFIFFGAYEQARVLAVKVLPTTVSLITD